MPMDRSNSTGNRTATVLSVECLNGSSKADEWTGDMLQIGDIVEEITIEILHFRSPFKNGRAEIQKVLHSSFKSKETSINVRVWRGSEEELTELVACIVPNNG